MFHNINIPSFDQPSINHHLHNNNNSSSSSSNNSFTIPNDENAIQHHHKLKQQKPSLASSNRKPSSSKKGLALKPINENTNNIIRNSENVNVFKKQTLPSFPKTPSSSFKSNNQKKERRRALGDISNRKAGNSKSGGGNGSSNSKVGFHGLKSVKNDGSNNTSKGLSTRKSSTKKKKSSSTSSLSSSLQQKKSVTFDQQIFCDGNNEVKKPVLKSSNKKAATSESSLLRSSEKSQTELVQSSNRMKIKHVDVDDIELSAGRTWEQEQEFLQDDILTSDIEDIKFDFEEEERQIEQSYWLKQNQEYEEDLRLGQEMVEREIEKLFVYEDLEPRVFDDEFDVIPFSIEKDENDFDDDCLATKRVCSLDDDNNISI